MKVKDVISIIAVIVVAIGIRELFPKREVRAIPRIVTKYDTVYTRPQPLKPRAFTSDTFNLVFRQTLHIAPVVYVGCDSGSTRENVWPVMQYAQRSRDTAEVRTFSLRSGWGASSIIHTPGPLTALYMDTLATPRLSYGAWPGVPFGQKVKYLAYGAAGVKVTELLFGVLKE